MEQSETEQKYELVKLLLAECPPVAAIKEISEYIEHLQQLVSDFADSAGSGAPIFPWEPAWTPDWYEKREAQRRLARE